MPLLEIQNNPKKKNAKDQIKDLNKKLEPDVTQE